MKLVHKVRTGARVSKTYDRAQTPCERLLPAAAPLSAYSIAPLSPYLAHPAGSLRGRVGGDPSAAGTNTRNHRPGVVDRSPKQVPRTVYPRAVAHPAPAGERLA